MQVSDVFVSKIYRICWKKCCVGLNGALPQIHIMQLAYIRCIPFCVSYV